MVKFTKVKQVSWTKVIFIRYLIHYNLLVTFTETALGVAFAIPAVAAAVLNARDPAGRVAIEAVGTALAVAALAALATSDAVARV